MHLHPSPACYLTLHHWYAQRHEVVDLFIDDVHKTIEDGPEGRLRLTNEVASDRMQICLPKSDNSDQSVRTTRIGGID